jgi:hypothetical protein
VTRRWAAALLAVLIGTAPVVAAPAASAAVAGQSAGRADACGDSSGVTVVVDFAELGGGVLVACASGLTAASRGADALAAAGISWSPPTSQPGFVCRLAGRPSADETFGTSSRDDYQENCVNTPPKDAYWSYWQSSGDGNWSYSDNGLTASRVKPGGFEGWSFSSGALFPPDYNPVSGGADAPLPEPEPQPVPQPQPEQPQPEQPQPQQPDQPAAPAPQQTDSPDPAASQPASADTATSAPPVETSTDTTAVAESSAGSDPSGPTTTTSSASATGSSTSADVTALAEPVSDSGGGGWGWALGGIALIAALGGAAFVVVRHRRHG